MKRILVVGDSVLWGQGLRERDKMAAVFAERMGAELGEAVDVVSFAHSGAITWPTSALDTLRTVLDRSVPAMPPSPVDLDDATIDAAGGRSSEVNAIARANAGEPPDSFPTIIAQLRAARRDVVDVDWIVVNGGINDVGVLNIVLPYKKPSDLAVRVAGYAGYARASLAYARRAFPRAGILYVPYYPIVSPATDLSALLEFGRRAFETARNDSPLHHAALGTFDDLIRATLVEEEIVPPGRGALDVLAAVRVLMSRLSTVFHDGIRAVLSAEIAAFNGQAGARASLVTAPWSDDYSILALHSRLWGIDLTLVPRDPVAAERRVACGAVPKTNAIEAFVCERASIGHPNEAGARAFGDALFAEWHARRERE